MEYPKVKVKKVGGQKLKKGVYYKFLVVAVDKDGNVIGTSTTVYAATRGGKVTNPKKIKITNPKKTKAALKKLKPGSSYKIKTKTTKAASKLQLKQYRAVRFESSDPKVASVNAKGKVTGVKKGTCYIYAYAQNGVMTKVKVTVKG